FPFRFGTAWLPSLRLSPLSRPAGLVVGPSTTPGWSMALVPLALPMAEKELALPKLSEYSSTLARPQLVEHGHERLVGRRRLAGDVEVGDALGLADLLRENEPGLVDTPELNGDAPERGKIFPAEFSRKFISERSP